MTDHDAAIRLFGAAAMLLLSFASVLYNTHSKNGNPKELPFVFLFLAGFATAQIIVVAIQLV